MNIPVLRIHDIFWYHTDPAIFVIDLQDAKKTNFLKSSSAYYFLNVHLHHFSRIKSQNEVTKQKESRFFLLFLLDDRRDPAIFVIDLQHANKKVKKLFFF